MGREEQFLSLEERLKFPSKTESDLQLSGLMWTRVGVSLFHITPFIGFPSFPQDESKTFIVFSTVEMDCVPSCPVATLSMKATLIIKIEHKFVLFNRFGFNFASVGRHLIKIILSFPLLLPPFFFWWNS